MTKRKSLKSMQRLFARKKYSDVVRILEPEIFRFRESFQFYSLLGLSCLYLDDNGGAFSYLNRALQIKDDDVTTLLGLAAVHFKKRNFDEALRLWLRVVEREPNNKTAQRGLGRVRKGVTEEEIASLADSGRIRRYYPSRSLRIPPVVVVIFLICLAGAAGFFIITHGEMSLDFLVPPSDSRIPRLEIDAIQLSNDALRTDEKVQARFTLTEKQVDEIWKKAKDYFNAWRDNLAVVELNRLLNSNASSYIKELCRRLKNLARIPGFKDMVAFQDNVGFTEVSAGPFLYDGCFVLWRGTIASLVFTSEKISFQFLVGSHDNRVFEGSAGVVFDFGDKLESNTYIELLAKVVAQGEKFYLKGVLHRRIIPESPLPR